MFCSFERTSELLANDKSLLAAIADSRKHIPHFESAWFSKDKNKDSFVAVGLVEGNEFELRPAGILVEEIREGGVFGTVLNNQLPFGSSLGKTTFLAALCGSLFHSPLSYQVRSK